MSRAAITLAPIIACSTLLSGCTSYEYVITEPSEFAGTLSKRELTVARAPVTYHFVDQSSRVGIRVENTTDGPLTFKGEKSYVVTPFGQSEPMHNSTIAPQAWSAFTVPPVVQVYGGGGGFSFGIGVGSWGSHGGGGVGLGYGGGYGDCWYPPYNETVWNWKDGAVHMHLVYESRDAAGGAPVKVEQDFTIERRKKSK